MWKICPKKPALPAVDHSVYINLTKFVTRWRLIGCGTAPSDGRRWMSVCIPCASPTWGWRWSTPRPTAQARRTTRPTEVPTCRRNSCPPEGESSRVVNSTRPRDRSVRSRSIHSWPSQQRTSKVGKWYNDRYNEHLFHSSTLLSLVSRWTLLGLKEVFVVVGVTFFKFSLGNGWIW